MASGREIRAGNFPSANAANYRRQLRRRPRRLPGAGTPGAARAAGLPPLRAPAGPRAPAFPGAASAAGLPPVPGQPPQPLGAARSARIHHPGNRGAWVLSGERHLECGLVCGEGEIERCGAAAVTVRLGAGPALHLAPRHFLGKKLA